MTTAWYVDPMVLIDDYTAFFPTESMDDVAKINALVRLSIYVAIVLVLYTKKLYPLYIPFFAMVLSAFMTSGQKAVVKKQLLGKVSPSTKENPFMNKLISDYVENPDKAEAPVYHEDNEEARLIKQEIEDNFYGDMYRDVNDVFNKHRFYTMPSTAIVNDQKEFAQACFGNMPSCKSDRFDCAPVEDLRQKRAYVTVSEPKPADD